MEKKSLQRERTKCYFIDAAKEIIKTKGLAQASARNVADLAGYSYATIYNYFSDLNDLLWYVTVDLIEEMSENLRPYIVGADPIGRLKLGYREYVRYYLDRPEVYHFLFHAQIGQPSAEVEPRLKTNRIGEQQDLVLRDCITQGLISSADAPILAQLLVTVIHGLLSMHFTSYQQLSEAELFQALDYHFDFILQRLTK